MKTNAALLLCVATSGAVAISACSFGPDAYSGPAITEPPPDEMVPEGATSGAAGAPSGGGDNQGGAVSNAGASTSSGGASAGNGGAGGA